MSFQVTSKLEINLLNTNAKTKPQYVLQFVKKHKIPAIVASPEYMAPLVASRAVLGGGFKLICALDFPKGDNFAMDKLFRANPDFVAADGFDILLTSNRTEVESKNEMKSIFEYLKANRPLTEIRWCLSMHKSLNESIGILKNMKSFPPSFVRIDPHLENQNINAEKLQECVEIVRTHVPYPIKVSGNIDLEIFNKLKDNRNIKRFDVSIEQAEALAKGLKMASLAAANVPPSTSTGNGPAVKNFGPKINL